MARYRRRRRNPIGTDFELILGLVAGGVVIYIVYEAVQGAKQAASGIESAYTSLSQSISNIPGDIESAASGAYSSATGALSNAATNAGNAILSPFTSASSWVSSEWDSLFGGGGDTSGASTPSQ